MKWIKSVFSTVIILLVAVSAWSADYYVAKNGNDTNPGTESHPWKTIQKAASTLRPSDTVYVKAGTYNESIVIKRSGSNESSRIVFSAYPGHTPVLDGKGKVSKWRGVIYSNAGNVNYITIDGFEIKNSIAYGIRIDDCHHWIITNCNIHNVGEDGFLGVYTNNTLVQNNKVHNTGWNGISIMGGGNNIIEYNDIYDNKEHCGFQFITNHTDRDTSFYSNNIARFNRVSGNRHGCYFRNQKSMKIYGNYIYNNTANNGYAGIFLHNGDGSSSSFDSNSEIYNNTIVGHPKSIANSSHRNVTYWNNIFYKPSSEPFRLTGSGKVGQKMDYNCYYGKDFSMEGGNGFYSDPLFVDSSKDNYSVKMGSPTLGTGKNGDDVGAHAFKSSDNNDNDKLVAPNSLKVVNNN